MSLCINPECTQINSDENLFCHNCNLELLILGRYRVTKLLSDKGGFGNTYEVMYHSDIKVLKALKDSNPKAIELFKREFDVLAQVDHPGIPKVAEYFEFQCKNNQPPLRCFVMEKIVGIDLEEYMQKMGKPIDEQCALDWLEQLGNILQKIHSHNLLHRDIKPSNIILKPSGQLVLIDFGAVGMFNRLQPRKTQHTYVFTPGYAAPEQIQGKSLPQSDFFSLGHLFVYLLTLKIIGMSVNEIEIERNNWHNYAPNLSPELVDFINRLMNEQVDIRPANAQVLLSEVHALNLELCPTASSFYNQPKPISPTEISPNPDRSVVAAKDPVPGKDRSRSSSWNLIKIFGGLGLMGVICFGILKSCTSNSTPKPPVVPNLSSSPPPGNLCSSNNLTKKVDNNLYGTIEIGSTGIKGQVIKELANANEDGFKLVSHSEKIPEINANAVDPKAQTEAVTAVKKMYKDLQDKFSIPCEQIVIYGSSGLAQKAPNKDELAKEILKETGKSVEFISPEAEATFTFDGVVPEWRRSSVLLLDIGSGNTKGGYLQGSQTHNFKTFVIPLGTKTFTKVIASQQKDLDFTKAAETTKSTVLIPQIRDMVQRRPAMQNSSRVYLSGGITWALSTLIHPCVQEQKIQKKEERISQFSRLSAADINTFYNNVTRDRKRLFQPDLSACQPEQRQKVQKEIEKIKNDVFSTDNLIAGAEIMRAFSQELKFDEKDTIFFARYAIEALPIGYLMSQIESLEKSGNSSKK